MNKAELIQSVATQSGESKSTVERVLKGFEAAVTDALAAGGDVVLQGFGTFSVADKPERQGRNPQTGEPLTIAAHKAPKFKPGANLKTAVNG
ncbi:HU family DNA-binding protein [Uruburuella testudinis]|uniref:HU family DNA-binding protein n=1 Tax=Uruburuella testudinis TaxID=1282863 RepID=A0ABY4DXH1_9NEIS|nr:HU family DNA-binding protein [Uruburuella testudinis]UOO82779.1 HU family DNA-binding protein [Uruburuella testudinis]